MHDSVEWTSGNNLKGISRVKSWLECLEGVISGHTEPITGTARPHPESSDSRDICNQRNYSNQVLSRLRSESWVGNPISHSLCTIGVFQIHASYFSTETTVTIWDRLHDLHTVWGWNLPSSCWKCLVTPSNFGAVVSPSVKSFGKTHRYRLGNLNFFYLDKPKTSS